ncbi:GNAT family N-acetyltransferase [uncultured Lacinutrix sp.]|uniref:GNAT family N-acetyltransferase n=1 Tax=uncultured Lacinutrix sp. TaxID=574032 RepID=UPI002610B09B|nr:GNAT family N-acetyltransferase [uncultured Lacinutrix sp.]
MIEISKGIYFSSKREDMDFKMIYCFIKDSYWGALRTEEEQKTAMDNTINFGLFHDKKQIAYARVMTDKIFFAYLLDVLVIKEYQGQGFSKVLMREILNFPELKNIDKWMLATKDAHGLYEKYGFTSIASPEKLMEKLNERAKKIYK